MQRTRVAVALARTVLHAAQLVTPAAHCAGVSACKRRLPRGAAAAAAAVSAEAEAGGSAAAQALGCARQARHKAITAHEAVARCRWIRGGRGDVVRGEPSGARAVCVTARPIAVETRSPDLGFGYYMLYSLSRFAHDTN